MRLKTLSLAGLLAGLLFGTAAASADLSAAQAAFASGMDAEKAGQYTAAIDDFKAALQGPADFPTAYKQLGDCYYNLGDYRQALRNYNTYLASQPEDAGVWDVARRLRKRVEQDDREDRAAVAGRAVDATDDGIFYAGVAGSLEFPDGNDLLNFPGETGGSVGGDLAGSAEIHAGYLSPNGLGLEAGFEDWLRTARVHTQNYFFSASNNFVIAEYEAYAEPLVRFPLGRSGALIAGVRIGLSEALVTQDNYGYGGALGSALVLAPELRYQLLFLRRYGLEIGAEYRGVDFDTLNTNAGAIPDSSGLGTWNLVDSGLVLRAGIDVYFDR